MKMVPDSVKLKKLFAKESFLYIQIYIHYVD